MVDVLDLTINQLLQAYYIVLLTPNADVNKFVTRARNVLTDAARAMMSSHFPRDEASASLDAARSSQVNLPYSPDILGAQTVQSDVHSRRRY